MTHSLSSEQSKRLLSQTERSAANGLLDRRALLRSGALFAGSFMGYSLVDPAQAAEGLPIEKWMQVPGEEPAPYQLPSRFEKDVIRRGVESKNGIIKKMGHMATPLHMLTGTITPNGLFHTRLHTGIPDIDPDKHRLLIHGLVKRPLIFTLEQLSRYPTESRIYFLECGGNSELIYDDEPIKAGIQRLHGQLSCAEWSGVRLATLLEEAGVQPEGKWVLAEGADAAGMTRSLPMEKIMDDALVATHMNGERLMPGNGYPMRLFLPGTEGNMNVKFLRRIKVLPGPTMSRDETSKYTMTRPNGKSSQFNLVMEAKSAITHPAPEHKMNGPGLYQISGLAWSGYGKVAKVEVSADGGKSWAEAHLQTPVRTRALTRFHLPWQWDGGPALLQSRCTDNTGYVQPTRAKMIEARSRWANYHGNCITTWAVNPQGELSHVYA
jgi:sulfane dehydrogenase subunit SoxC